MSALTEYYENLLALTQEEHVIIKSGRFADLNKILEKKKNLIEKINANKGETQEKSIEIILQTIEKIKNLGDENYRLLEEEMEDIGKKLELLLRSKNALSSQRKTVGKEAAIFDFKA